MFAQLSVNTQQAYRPFYDGHAAGLCFAPQAGQTQQQDNRTICDRMADDAQGIANGVRQDYPRATARFALQEFNNRFGRFTYGTSFGEGPLGWITSSNFSSSPSQNAGTAPYRGQTGFARQFLEGDNPAEDQVHHFGAYFSAGLAGNNFAPAAHRAFTDGRRGNTPDVLLANQGQALGAYLRNNPRQLNRVGELIRSTICGGNPVP